MSIVTVKRFAKTYVATVVLALTGLLMGSSVISSPELFYIPQLHGAAHSNTAMCEVAEEPVFVDRNASSDDADIFPAIYRTITHPGCKRPELLFI